MLLIKDSTVDIAGVCETWLMDSNNPTTATIKSHGYSIIHNHRKSQKGGGTAVIFRSCFSLSVFSVTKQFKTFELTAVTVKSTSKKIVIIILYRSGPLTYLFIQELDELLSESLARCDYVLLAGDLNIHFEHTSDSLVKQCSDVLESYGLMKHVNDTTHINGGSLDQVFSYSHGKELVSGVHIDAINTLGSVHYPVFCDLELTLDKKYFKEIEYRTLKDIDNQKFSTELQTMLIAQKLSGNFGTAVRILKDDMTNLLDCHAPLVTKKISIIDSAPWFDKEYRSLRSLRRKAESKWRKTRSVDDHLKYKNLCQEATRMAQSKKKAHFSKMIDRANGNPHTLYTLVNKELDRKQSKKLPDFTDDMSELAHVFNEFFVDKINTIRENMVDDVPPALEISESLQYWNKFEPTTLDEIKDIISESGIKCSPDDLLPQKLFKSNIEVMLPTIVDLVNLSLETGNVDGVKLADIIPWHKGDALDPNNLKNFRPISNLTYIGKIIERVVLRRLNTHLNTNNLNCKEQFGYKKHHSTESLLIRVTNDILVASDERTATVVMLLDLSAAFDTVDHSLLLRILEHEIGIKGVVLNWFRSFLSGRTQRIRLGNTVSEEIFIKFGVPQGSVLGPVLFNLYIRSIYKCVQKLGFHIFGYADDHQILKSFNATSQSMILANELSHCFKIIKKWTNQYYLQLNDSKTQIIVFGSSKVLNNINIKGVNISAGTTIRFISTVKSLGIYMDSRLSMELWLIR